MRANSEINVASVRDSQVDDHLTATLQWVRLTGLLCRQQDLLQRLLSSLLRQREAIVLVDYSSFQNATLEQIHLLEELEGVREGAEESIISLAEELGVEPRAPLSRIIERAPEEFRDQLVKLQGHVARLASDVRQLGKRNHRLMEALGEIQGKQYEAVLEAISSGSRTYEQGVVNVPPTSLYEVTA